MVGFVPIMPLKRCCSSVTRTEPARRFVVTLSLSVTIGLIGAIYGGGPVSYMREQLGYQSVIEIFAVAGVVLAAITYWVVPDVKTPSQGTVISVSKKC